MNGGFEFSLMHVKYRIGYTTLIIILIILLLLLIWLITKDLPLEVKQNISKNPTFPPFDEISHNIYLKYFKKTLSFRVEMN